MKPRIFALVVTLAILPPFQVRAGIVSFTPETTEIVLGVDDPIVEVVVTLTSVDTLLQFEAFEVVVGSNDGLEIVHFAPSVDAATYGACKWGCYPTGIYPSDISVNVVAISGFLFTPFTLGTLAVDASDLGPGTYELLVDGKFDERSIAILIGGEAIETEPLYGIGTIVIIPDPATMTLLAAGIGLALLRRDRRQRTMTEN